MPFVTSKFDWFVFFVASIVFLYSFIFMSFHPFTDDDGNIVYDIRHNTITEIGTQVFIAPIILVYEMFVLILFENKRRGRELPWKLYWLVFKEIIIEKLHSGMDEYKEWKNNKNK